MLTQILLRLILMAPILASTAIGADAQSVKGICDVTILQSASASQVEELLQQPPGPFVRCYDGYTPLHVAVQAGNLDAIEIIAQSGADLNAHNDMRSTALHVAVMGSRPDIVALLIKLGADIEAQGSDGDTPLSMAKSWNETAIVDVLIKAGARY